MWAGLNWPRHSFPTCSSGSGTLSRSQTFRASATVSASKAIQSNDLQAGTTPTVLRQPRVGLYPTIPLKAAGTRPEPAVSVARENEQRPAATETALPEDDPPEIYSLLKTHDGAPYGDRTPTSPVAS